VAFSMAWLEAGADRYRAVGLLDAFRGELYRCLTGRADALFELADAVLCADGPVRCWRPCRWSRSIAAGTGRRMTR
jgi:hypothetical protein